MSTTVVLLLAWSASGISVYAAVQRRAVLAAFAALAFLLLAVAWAGGTFDVLDV